MKPGLHELHGYAIVSDDGMIADASGAMPASLKNEADWAYFQAQLDLSQLVLVGRRSHEAAPSSGRRRRVVMSRAGAGLERRGLVWWWNPAALPLADMLAQLLPEGGRVAVPGGQAVFDLIGQARAFDQFHLAHAVGVALPGGQPAFSAQRGGGGVGGVEAELRRQGLRADAPLVLDAQAPVTLTVWRRPPAG